jgi:plasmid stabilization system protein ParE
MGRFYSGLGTAYRVFPAHDYMIFYRESSHGIDIVRVLYGARDITALFQTDH